MADLPDFYSFVLAALTKAINLTSGLDAAKADSPTVGDVYVATDSTILYVCYEVGDWVNVGALYLLLAGGTMAGAIAMGANKITGLGAPADAGDALRKGTALTITEMAALTTGKIWQGVANRPSEVDMPAAASRAWLLAQLAVDALPTAIKALVATFQTNPATGDFSANPENINDNNNVSYAYADTIDQYAEVDYGVLVVIKRWRQFGEAINALDGEWKIQYYNLATLAWTDWVTGIATRGGNWSSLVTETPVICQKIRIVCVAVDTQGVGADKSGIGELEVIY